MNEWTFKDDMEFELDYNTSILATCSTGWDSFGYGEEDCYEYCSSVFQVV